MAEHVRVAVRVRPFSKRELAQGCECVVSMEEQHTTVQSKPARTFASDVAYWSHDPEAQNHASQGVLMRDIGSPILRNAVAGYNGCLFAYGQTGSGKTYSLLGDQASPGIMPCVIDELFHEKTALEANPHKQLRVWISYFEIYNDHLYDLLEVEGNSAASGSDASSKHDASQRLAIRDHPNMGVFVPGLSTVPCESADDVHRLVAFGHKRRAIAATAMNDHSSRSHAVFVIKLQCLDSTRTEAGERDDRKELHSRINLVDLAGAERQSKVNGSGTILKQGCAINKGLSALALVIKELADRQSMKAGSNSGIPFRASKLTWLLKDSLAGNSRTHMLANISPACENLSETISTLRFAASVKTIKTVATQNRCTQDELVSSLKRELEALRARIMAPRDSMRQQVQVFEREQLIADLTQDYKLQTEHAKLMQEIRDSMVKDMALSADGIHTGFGVDAQTPYLLNMASCSSLAGSLLYYIPQGLQRTIGSAQDNSICLTGLGLAEYLCIVENASNTRLTVRKCSHEGRIVINGKPLESGTSRELDNGDRVVFGISLALRVSIPSSHAKRVLQCRDTELLLQGLEDESLDIEASPSWAVLHEYLSQVIQQLPPAHAESLCRDVRQVVRLCDEANEITSVCRASDVHFEARLTSGSPPSVVVCVLEKDAAEPTYNWTLIQMGERLDRMRESYTVFSRTGHFEVDALDNPWVEAHPADVWERLRALEVRLEDACERNLLLELRSARAVAWGMLLWVGHQSDDSVRIIFGAWSQLVAPAHRKGGRRSNTQEALEALSEVAATTPKEPRAQKVASPEPKPKAQAMRARTQRSPALERQASPQSEGRHRVYSLQRQQQQQQKTLLGSTRIASTQASIRFDSLAQQPNRRTAAPPREGKRAASPVCRLEKHKVATPSRKRSVSTGTKRVGSTVTIPEVCNTHAAASSSPSEAGDSERTATPEVCNTHAAATSSSSEPCNSEQGALSRARHQNSEDINACLCAEIERLRTEVASALNFQKEITVACQGTADMLADLPAVSPLRSTFDNAVAGSIQAKLHTFVCPGLPQGVTQSSVPSDPLQLAQQKTHATLTLVEAQRQVSLEGIAATLGTSSQSDFQVEPLQRRAIGGIVASLLMPVLRAPRVSSQHAEHHTTKTTKTPAMVRRAFTTPMELPSEMSPGRARATSTPCPSIPGSPVIVFRSSTMLMSPRGACSIPSPRPSSVGPSVDSRTPREPIASGTAVLETEMQPGSTRGTLGTASSSMAWGMSGLLRSGCTSPSTPTVSPHFVRCHIGSGTVGQGHRFVLSAPPSQPCMSARAGDLSTPRCP